MTKSSMPTPLLIFAAIVSIINGHRAYGDNCPVIRQLDPGFVPSTYANCQVANSNCDHPPTGKLLQSGPYFDQISGAYAAAPTFFQKFLCSPNTIYISTDTSLPLAWGVRKNLHGKKYDVGIRTDLLDQLSSYVAYENILLKALLAPAGSPPADIIYSSDDANTGTAAVLGVLAHEIAHAIWWDYKVWLWPNNNQFYFTQYSWGNGPTYIPYWHDFGQSTAYFPADGSPTIFDVIYDLKQTPNTKAYTDLVSIYGGKWATLFATEGPDEDFVETFKLVTVQHSKYPLNSLVLHIDSNKADVIKNFNNTNYSLYQKRGWIEGQFP